jgi:hypothetical protein
MNGNEYEVAEAVLGRCAIMISDVLIWTGIGMRL